MGQRPLFAIAWNEKRGPKNERKAVLNSLQNAYLLNSKRLFMVRPRPPRPPMKWSDPHFLCERETRPKTAANAGFGGLVLGLSASISSLYCPSLFGRSAPSPSVVFFLLYTSAS
jgi:hypothetical protein